MQGHPSSSSRISTPRVHPLVLALAAAFASGAHAEEAVFHRTDRDRRRSDAAARPGAAAEPHRGAGSDIHCTGYRAEHGTGHLCFHESPSERRT
jgi:hypothetical protein